MGAVEDSLVSLGGFFCDSISLVGFANLVGTLSLELAYLSFLIVLYGLALDAVTVLLWLIEVRDLFSICR